MPQHREGLHPALRQQCASAAVSHHRSDPVFSKGKNSVKMHNVCSYFVCSICITQHALEMAASY